MASKSGVDAKLPSVSNQKGAIIAPFWFALAFHEGHDAQKIEQVILKIADDPNKPKYNRITDNCKDC